MELYQLGGEVVLPWLEIDRPWQAEVAHRIDCAFVSIASVSNGDDGGAELAFRRLF